MQRPSKRTGIIAVAILILIALLVYLVTHRRHGPRSTPALWTGLLNSGRAIDWRGAGAGNLPDRSASCQVLGTPGGTVATQQSVTMAQIQAALLSCANSNKSVLLNPGTYRTTTTLFGAGVAAPNGVSLGSVAGPKTIKFQIVATSNNCSGTGRVAFCIYNGDSGALKYSANVLQVTSGVAPGSTSIVLGSPPSGSGGSASNLRHGSLIALNQLDDPNTDNGQWWECGTAPYCTWGGISTAWGGRQYTQIVTVDTVSGNTVTFFPALYPGWSQSKQPYATFSGNAPVTGFGLENLTIDASQAGELASIVNFMWATNSWAKNVSTINNTVTGQAAKTHYMIGSDAHISILNSYMYGANPQNSGYGVDFLWGTADSLAENNITQHMPTGMILETGIGNVFAYNFDVDNYFGGDWQQCENYHHGGGDAFDLFESDEGICGGTDDIHGTSYAITFNRDFYSGHDPATQCPGGGTSCGTQPKTAATVAFFDQSYARYTQVVMSVLGDPNWANTYANVGKSGNPSQCPSFPWTVIFSLGFGNGNQTPFSPACQGSSFTLDNDDVVTTSLMRWGNWDTVSKAVVTDASQNGSSYGALANPSQNWAAYPSFYRTDKPPFWGSQPWPAIGPDVTGGFSLYAGHLYHIPAAICYLDVLGGKKDGSSGPLNFDANDCYKAGPPPAAAAAVTFEPAPGPEPLGTTVNLGTTTPGCNPSIWWSSMNPPTTSTGNNSTAFTVNRDDITIYAQVLNCPGYGPSPVASGHYTIAGPPTIPAAVWTWSAPPSVNGVTAATYNLYQLAGSCGVMDLTKFTSVAKGVTGTTYTQQNPPSGTQCNAVTAVSSSGQEGPPFPTAPGPPGNLVVTSSPGGTRRKLSANR